MIPATRGFGVNASCDLFCILRLGARLVACLSPGVDSTTDQNKCPLVCLMKQKAIRLLEIVGVPLALAWVGNNLFFLTNQLIGLLGHEYVTTSTTAVLSAIFWLSVCGLAAGIGAVVVQRSKAWGRRWSFYGFMVFSALVGVVFVFAIEATRSRLMGLIGFPAMRPDIDRVPFWIISVGFWFPFLFLLRSKKSSAPGAALGSAR